MTVTRPHHPFKGKTLDILRHARRQGRLYLVLVLPDGSRSLIPADWTDLHPAAIGSAQSHPFASQQDLLRLRALADALLNRTVSVDPAVIPVMEEGHATTKSVHGAASSGNTSVGTTGSPAETNHRRDTLSSPRQSHPTGKAKGARNP